MHQNTKIPKWLKLNIISTSIKFPDSKIFVLSNGFVKENILSDQKNVKVLNFDSSIMDRHSKFLSHGSEFRNNFWWTSISRFYLMKVFMEQFPEPFIHVESDVILAADFPIKKFLEISKTFSFPITSNKRAIASIFFIKELSILDKLVDFIVEQVVKDSKSTDMLILKKFQELNQKFFYELPSDPKNSFSDEIFV